MALDVTTSDPEQEQDARNWNGEWQTSDQTLITHLRLKAEIDHAIRLVQHHVVALVQHSIPREDTGKNVEQ